MKEISSESHSARVPSSLSQHRPPLTQARKPRDGRISLTLFTLPSGGVCHRRGPSDPLASDTLSSAGNSTGGEQVRCYACPNEKWLLPFLDRPTEVKSLLFDTPINAGLSERLRTWATRHGPQGQECLDHLTEVDRDSQSDDAWLTFLRERILPTAPDLWVHLSQVLGADVVPAPKDERTMTSDHWTAEQEPQNAFDDGASESSSVMSSPHSRAVFSSPNASKVKGSPDSGIEIEGLHDFPQTYQRPLHHVESPSFCEEDLHNSSISHERRHTHAITTPAGRCESQGQGLALTNASESGMATPMANYNAKTPMAEVTPRVSSVNSTEYFPPQEKTRAVNSRTRRNSVVIRHPDASDDQEMKRVNEGHFRCLRVRTSSEDGGYEPSRHHRHDSNSSQTSPAVKKDGTEASLSSHRLTYRHHRRMSSLLDPLIHGEHDEEQNDQTSSRISSTQQRSMRDDINLIRRKELSFHRPQSQPSLDDAELFNPQKSKYSFARSFQGLTMMDARRNPRPKAYSTTQYSSDREKNRIQMGQQAVIPPYEVAAALEAEGKPKPKSLGVLEDGRTCHPSAGMPSKPSTVAAFRLSLGLSPGVERRRSASGSPPSGNSPKVAESKTLPAAQEDDVYASPIPNEDFATTLPAAKSLRQPDGSSYGTSFMLPTATKEIQPHNSQGGPPLQSPPIKRRPDGFTAYSREWQAVRRQRAAQNLSVGTPSSVVSTGSEAVASSEGSTVADFEPLSSPGEDDANDEDEDMWGTQHAAHLSSKDSLGSIDGRLARTDGGAGTTTPSARSSSKLPAGELGLDFGGDQAEHDDDARRSQRTSGVSRSPVLPAAHQAFPTIASKSRHQPDQIVFPIPPGTSRAKVLAQQVQSIDFVSSAIGEQAWIKAKRLMSEMERETMSDRELIERLALGYFGLVDLESKDPSKREEAEAVMCDDVDGYTKRWKAFASLLMSLEAPVQTLTEAERRCGPGEALCIRS